MLNASGQIVAAIDGSGKDASVAPTLPAGAYTVRVVSRGLNADLGKYNLSISEAATGGISLPNLLGSTGGPATLTAAPVAGTTSARLNWSNVAGNLGYSIDESADGITFTPIGNVGTNVTTYTTANRSGGTRYFYRVRTISLQNGSSPVATVVTAPAAPTVYQTLFANTSFPHFYWNNSVGNNGYKILRSQDNVNFTQVASHGRNWIVFGDGGLTGGTYHYRIVPIGDSVDGAATSVSVTTPIAAPTITSVSNSTASSLKISWDVNPSAVSYKVFRSLNGNDGWTEVGTVNGATNTTFTNTGLAPLTNYYYYVQAIASSAASNSPPSGARSGSTQAAAALPAGWAQSDVGPVRGPGATGFVNDVYQINASGYDIIGREDSGRLTYRLVEGDAAIIARIDSFTADNDAAKAGLWIRQGLGTGDTSIALMLNKGAQFGIDFRVRDVVDGNTRYQAVKSSVSTPYWLKLVRVGDTINGFYSANGVDYVLGATASVALSDPIYVGFGVTAFSDWRMATAKFSNVSISTTQSVRPTIVTPAAAAEAVVTGRSVELSVLAADEDGTESALTYTWSAGANAGVTFSRNSTNAAKSTVATFSRAGQYTFTVVARDADGLTTMSTVDVRVDQVLTGIAATASTMAAGTAQQIRPIDQFSQPMVDVARFTWSTDKGRISTSGLLVAPERDANQAVITGRNDASAFTTTVAIVRPTAWYRADETGGSSLNDSSEFGRDASLTGSYGFGEGKTGNALDLSGGHASLPSGVVSSLTDFTIAAWVYLDSKPTWSRIFDFGTGTDNYMFLSAAGSNADTLRFAIRTPTSGGERVVNAPSIVTGQWAHVAVTLAGETATLYVNGVAVGTSGGINLNPSSLGQTTANYLGKAQFNDPAFDGRIDDFRIYGNGLGSGAIRGIFEAWSLAQRLVPDAPRDLAARVSGSGVALTWVDVATDESGFRVERSTDGGATYEAIATLPADEAAFADGTVAAGMTYSYRVVAFNDAGSSDHSNVAEIVIAPAAPTNLAAEAGDARVTLGWQASSGASGYALHRSADGGESYQTIATLPGDTTTFVDQAVVNGTTYVYRVVATNFGGVSEPSAQATATPQVPLPVAPTGLTADTASASRISVRWTDQATNEAGYRVERSADGGQTFATVATLAADAVSFTDDGLSAATTYLYRVVAFNDAGDSGHSNVAEATTVPLAPTALTASAGDARATLSWHASSGASGYEVRRSTSADGPYATLATLSGASSTGYVDLDVVNGTTYHYVVVALNAGGSSDPSAVAAATPQVPAPLAPSGLVVTATSSDTVSLSWTDNADNESGYRIERSTDGGVTFTLLTTIPLSADTTSYLDRELTAGTSYVYRVFAYNAGGESGRSGVASGTTRPDVAIGGLTSSSAQPGVGDTVVLSTTLTNRGNATLRDVVVRFYDGDPAAGGTVIGSTTIAELAGNASKTVSINWAPTTSGSRTLYAVADPAGTLGDTNLADNRAMRAQEVFTYFTYKSTARLVGTGAEGGREVHKWYAFDVNVPMDFIAQLRVIAEVGQYDMTGSSGANNRAPYLQSYVGDGYTDRQLIGEVQPNAAGNWAMSSTDALVTAGIMPLMTNYVDLWIKDLDGSGNVKDQVKVDSVTVEIKYFRR